MNKSAVKTFAIWARKELIEKVSQKAFEYGVSKENVIDAGKDNINGKILSIDERNMRDALVREVKTKGFDQVMEESAYTWFNRLIALRYMEVNNYLPNKTRIFTDENNEFKPQIIDEAINIDLIGLDKTKVYKLLENNQTEDLYKYLLITTCNDMQQYLPGLFCSLSGYVQLLCPDGLLKNDSVIARMIYDIDLDSWTDQIQIIGWMYQYYVSEKHYQIIDMAAKTMITKENIPAATQLFTTDWVVKYMVDNSLGQYWLERHPDSEIQSKLEFFIKPKNGKVDSVNEKLLPEELTFIDPCMGSGHILVYAFDVLMKIYVSEGWNERDAAVSILKNNIYGLDIDERAYQLSYFALMMKARQYNRKVFNEGISPNICAIEESDTIEKKLLEKFGNELKPLAEKLVNCFINAKELGSIINVPLTENQLVKLEEKLIDIDKMADYGNLLVQAESYELVDYFYPLLKQAKILAKKYSVVTTNPPYMNKFSPKLKDYIGKNFENYKSDLFSVFMFRNFNLSKDGGYLGFMTPMVWMFIKSYEELRNYIIGNKNIATLIQFEYSAYEEATVPICSFVLKNKKDNSIGRYFRLSDFVGGMNVQKNKVLEAMKTQSCDYYFETLSANFNKIPGKPIAYWISSKLISAFKDGRPLSAVCRPTQGLATADNGRFLRLWFEVCKNRITFDAKSIEDALSRNTRWFPYNKGGDFRKWYGNNDYVVNWENDGYEIKHFVDENGKLRSRPQNTSFYFKECASWSLISSSATAFRYKPFGFIFDVAGMSFFTENNLMYYLGFCNTKIGYEILKLIAPTINFQAGDIAKLPIIENKENESKIAELVENNIALSKSDWDSFETSWDFDEHPLIKNHVSTIKDAYTLWDKECADRFNTLKSNEEELNKIFINIYGLQDELTPDVENKDVTVRKADLNRDIKSLISYAVGCMFGRYSLDQKGLAYAGDEFDNSKYQTCLPDEDNILPITEEEYFEDDITKKFIDFVRIVYGEKTLEDNLTYIATALGGNGSSRDIIRRYFLNQFFTDHCNTYQVTGSGKRPIYWFFDAGRHDSFKCLIYVHRYQPDLIAKIRTDYILPHQTVLRNKADSFENEIEMTTNTSERVKLQKQLSKVNDQINELKAYEEKIHHYADQMISIDLDDGVKANYAKFGDLLAKIK